MTGRFGNDKLTKAVIDFRFLMNLLENKAKELGIWNATANTEQITQIFQRVKTVLVLDSETKSKRKRRAGQVKWSTMVNLVRKRDRQNARLEP